MVGYKITGDHMLTDGSKDDPLYPAALAHVLGNQKASISMLQRLMGIGYNHAARLIGAMETEGVVSPLDKLGVRHVLQPSGSHAVIAVESPPPSIPADMTGEEGQAYTWAIETPHNSVAARYARILAQYIERQHTEQNRNRSDE